VFERVQNVMEKYDNVKINTMFNDEFVAGNKITNKSIATRNSFIQPICENSTNYAL